VREYRANGGINMREGTGEMALARKGKVATAKGKGNALLVGTYHQDPDAIFINARLLRAADGLVLRTGQVMLTPNPVTLRMANAASNGRLSAVRTENKQQTGGMSYPEPGSGPLFSSAPTSASKSGGMKIVQAPRRKTTAMASTSKGLMGYVPE
jgi:hypothetical protein